MNPSRKSLLVSALLLVATLVPAVPVSAENGGARFIWPTTGRVTQPYGCTGFRMEPRRGSCAHFHGGIDIANRRGTPIRAAGNGVIRRVGWDQWGMRNWMVILDHGNGLVTWYAHMRGRHIDGIRKGVRVRQGQLIGYMDSTGFSTGPHLHWAVLRKGSYVNPRNYVQGLPGRNDSPAAADVDEDTGQGAPSSCHFPVLATVPHEPTAAVLQTVEGSGGQPEACAA